MKCQHIPMNVAPERILDSLCQKSPAHRLGRRLYCDEHAPEGSTPLDRFAAGSRMTDADKAAAYDQMAWYLRQQGWRVAREAKMPDDGRLVQWWDEGEEGVGSHTLMSALKVENFKDAPRQGERMAEVLAGFEKAVERKQKLGAMVVVRADGVQVLEDFEPRMVMVREGLRFLRLVVGDQEIALAAPHQGPGGTLRQDVVSPVKVKAGESLRLVIDPDGEAYPTAGVAIVGVGPRRDGRAGD